MVKRLSDHNLVRDGQITTTCKVILSLVRVNWMSGMMYGCDGRMCWEGVLGGCVGRVWWESVMGGCVGGCDGRVMGGVVGECDGRVMRGCDGRVMEG